MNNELTDFQIEILKELRRHNDRNTAEIFSMCIFRKDPDTVSGNFRTAFRNYPDSITAYPDTLSNH